MISKIKNLGKVKVFLTLASVLVLAQLLPSISPFATAATLTDTFVRFDSMNSSSTTTGIVCAEPASAGTVASVAVAFPTGFTVSTTTSNWTTSTATTTGWPSGGTAWPGIGTATSVSGQTVTFPSTALTVGTLYCFNWTNASALTQPSTPGSNETGTITTQTSAPAAIDTGSYATATVANDQITVTGTVSPTFSMSFSANSDPLGTLSQSSVSSSSASTFTVNTNDKNGWEAWVKDANSGLKSVSAAGYTISSTNTPGIGVNSTALTAGTEGINLGVTYSQTGGNCNSATAVNSYFNGASGKGGSFNTTLLPILTCSGSTNAGVVVPTNYASISGSTPAATDYSDVETFIAAGIF